jgi:hypothetical protein
MDTNPDDLIASLLAENEKLKKLEAILDLAHISLADGNTQLNIAREKLQQDAFSEAFLSATSAVEHYQKLIAYAQEVKDAQDTSPDVEQLIKDASDLLDKGQTILPFAKLEQFMANDLMCLYDDIELEIASENWILVGLYAEDAHQFYPNSAWFQKKAQEAKQKYKSQNLAKKNWLKLVFHL